MTSGWIQVDVSEIRYIPKKTILFFPVVLSYYMH